MNIAKQIKTCAIILVISSCSHIKLDSPKNDVIDKVEYRGQKYLIPIPEGYCRYNPNNKNDQPVLNFLNDARKEALGKVVALYEENCDIKQKILNGDLRDSPRSIEIDVRGDKEAKYGKETELFTRNEIIDLSFDSSSKKIDKEASKRSLIAIYEDLTKEKLMKYGFSEKRSEMMREDYKSYADFNNTKVKKTKDKYANYVMYFGRNKNMSQYSVQSTTKLYNKVISVIITRTLNSEDYSRNIANQVIDETKKYVKEFVSVNDKEDCKEYSYKGNKIKIFTPRDYYYLSGLKSAALKGRYKDGSGIPGFDFAEVFLYKDKNENSATLSIFLPNLLHAAFDKNNYGKSQFIEQTYQKTLQAINNISQYGKAKVFRERNGVFTLFSSNDLSASAGFSTMINHTPMAILLEVSHKKSKISNKDIEIMRKNLNEYIDFLEENQ